MDRHFEGVLPIQPIAAREVPWIELGAEPVENPGQGGFAAPALPRQKNQLALLHLQIDLPQLRALTAVLVCKRKLF